MRPDDLNTCSTSAASACSREVILREMGSFLIRLIAALPLTESGKMMMASGAGAASFCLASARCKTEPITETCVRTPSCMKATV